MGLHKSPARAGGSQTGWHADVRRAGGVAREGCEGQLEGAWAARIGTLASTAPHVRINTWFVAQGRGSCVCDARCVHVRGGVSRLHGLEAQT
jgi:hypothetical protein